MTEGIARVVDIRRPARAPAEALGGLATNLSSDHSSQFVVSLGRLLPKLGLHLEIARGVTDIRKSTAVDVRAWVDAPLPGGESPSLATRHNRRASARLGFRLLREAGIVEHDPTIDIRLQPRAGGREARPLTDHEVALGRAASQVSLRESRRPALWALAEATATTHEIPRVLSRHLDLAAGTVTLLGSSKTDPREAVVSQWGLQALERHLEALTDSERPLVYVGAGESPAAMQAAASTTLGRILNGAGLRADPAVMPGSIRAWAGLRVFRETGRIEEAALALGCKTLDTAAAIIGFEWRNLG